MRRPGRPRVPRGVFSFEDSTRLALVPREIVLDTSFVLEALLASQPRHEGARQFLEQLVTAGTTVYFNRLLELELAEAAFKIALQETHPKAWRRARHDGRSRRRGARLLDGVVTSWREVLSTVDSASVDMEEVIDGVPTLMSDYGLSSYDSVHAATAMLLGVESLATLDASFAALPERLLALHVDETRVRRCRQIRAG